MELWIRSQDKEALRKVNMGIMYWKDVNNRDCIVNIDNATGYSIMGAYETKERALEVLDKIHQRLIDLQTIEIAPDSYKAIKRNINCVYEMPKE